MGMLRIRLLENVGDLVDEQKHAERGNEKNGMIGKRANIHCEKDATSYLDNTRNLNMFIIV